MRAGTLGFIGYSLFAGFSIPGIDNAAHLGGLLGGLVMGAALASAQRSPGQALRNPTYNASQTGLLELRPYPHLRTVEANGHLGTVLFSGSAKNAPVVPAGKDGTVRVSKTAKNINSSGHLKLLIKFADAHPVRQHLDWFGVAERSIRRNFPAAMADALAQALATARK